MNKYNQDLDKNNANFVPLTPLSFLERAKDIYPNYEALVYENRSYTWLQIYNRCIKFASALEKIGIKEGDTVSVIAFNTPEIFEAHYSVPMTGAVLNTINTRLDAKTVSYILNHAEAKVLIVDRQLHSVVNKALENVESKPLIIDIQDDNADQSLLKKIGDKEYEDFLNTGDENYVWEKPKDEWQAISLSYTSGTTGNPKGVVYHHRGAYLNSIGNSLVWGMKKHPIYLWTLPMFHCNGWCFPWTITMLGGTHVCLRKIEAKPIYDAIADHKISHMCGAPIVMNMLINADIKSTRTWEHELAMMTAGAAPPAAVIEKMEHQKINVTHVYGLTEVYGPVTVCEWHDEWNELSKSQQASLKARQGVRYPVLEGLMVADPETLEKVPADGKTIGEVFMRGNVVMKGYLKNPTATKEAFKGDWFHTGDLGVIHDTGYIELKDRSKDIIISGGENISTIEVEDVLFKHPAVLEAAVVAKPSEKWGETPCAFVCLKPDEIETEESLIAFCRQNMAHYKAPTRVVFTELPKTSTGKIQKFILRDQAKSL